ncbi:MAG TPA: hypothetical protein ENN51_00470 [candidate division WOR-3 bacterium]|uniref:FlgD Ig-like domain-containing protein n=1 Tax=candidate division WOR-3 bacterium TaxID=2052148 RepID=A0A7V0T4F8_UNCW3|nr:hypothetical protein [candidate division WOR-3 bacterium]
MLRALALRAKRSRPGRHCRLSAFFAALVVLAAPAPAGDAVRLAEPVVNPASFALLANSRFSVPSGFRPDLPGQVMANVVWAMNRAPMLGTEREFYVATEANLYRYDPAAGTLVLHRPGDLRYNSGSAFEVGIVAGLDEDAGSAVQAGLLAVTAFREEHGASGCPMRWATDHANETWQTDSPVRMALVFGRAETRALDTTFAARRTGAAPPETDEIGLVEPLTAGRDSFEMVLMGLRQDTLFEAWALSLETVSQLLWAAAGPTPHRTIGGRPGLVIPTGFSDYPHTASVHAVRSAGTGRYHNRRGDSLARTDHRLELRSSVDRREDLRAAVPVPASAPDYFVVAVADSADPLARQEAGVAAFNLLTQARALGLAGRLVGPLSRAQARAVARALDLPGGETPRLVFAVGEAASDVVEAAPEPVEIVRARAVLRRGEGVRVDYLLRVPGPVRVEVFDMLGRPVHQLPETRRTAGYHSVEWDGTGPDGVRVKPGSYIIGIFGPGGVAQHKLSVL